MVQYSVSFCSVASVVLTVFSSALVCTYEQAPVASSMMRQEVIAVA